MTESEEIANLRKEIIETIAIKEREFYLRFTDFDKFKLWVKDEQKKVDSGFLENASYNHLLMNIASKIFFNKEVMPLYLYEDYLCLLKLLFKENNND